MPRSEVEPLMVWAGQACPCKIGELKILELRAKAQRDLWAKLSLYEFHNVVLRTGGGRLVVLEKAVEEWIARTPSGPRRTFSAKRSSKPVVAP